jgi:hypothetical protein
MTASDFSLPDLPGPPPDLAPAPEPPPAPAPAPDLVSHPRTVSLHRPPAGESPKVLRETVGDLISRPHHDPAPIVTELMAAGEISLWHGLPRSMKSFVLLRLLIDLAVGDGPALGCARFAIPSPRRIVYLTEEDPEIQIRKRLVGFLSGRPLVDELRLAEGLERLSVVIRKGLDFDSTEGRSGIISAIFDAEAEVVAFDPLRGFTSHSDQGPSDLRPVVVFLLFLLRETPVQHIILLHHDTKPSRDGKDVRARVHRASGGGIWSISDSPIAFERAEGPGLQTFCYPGGFKSSSDPDPFTVDVLHDSSEGTYSFSVVEASENAALDARIRAFVKLNPMITTRGIRQGVVGDESVIQQRVTVLVCEGHIARIRGSHGSQQHYLPEFYNPATHAEAPAAE